LFAVRQCADNFTVACPSGSDAECPAGDTCLFQTSLYQNASAAVLSLNISLPTGNDTSVLVRQRCVGDAK
jgi:hypothetical protein